MIGKALTALLGCYGHNCGLQMFRRCWAGPCRRRSTSHLQLGLSLAATFASFPLKGSWRPFRPRAGTCHLRLLRVAGNQFQTIGS